MDQKWQAILNTLSVGVVLTVNYYSQTGKINQQTIGELSARYDNLFTPAGYAFAIWGIIFLGLITYVIYQWIIVLELHKEVAEYKNAGYWFTYVNLANASWVVAWLYEYTGLSVVLMLFMLFGLLTIVIKTNMERWDAPLTIIAFVWWPICLYAGWISVATIANIAAYLSKLQWNGGFLSEEQWTIAMILVAAVINCFMIWSRNMREFALVGVWALVAIYIRHQETYPLIAWTAIFMAVFLLINISIHGYQNRSTNPFKKALRWVQNS
ncbi:tryptophan-rich sensory protein [Fulvivirga sp. M361]|uniref:tryptophan-rich sensory protein n=1 Tax=Fulvivirga sp. M361 TaxID=2594266 RepID=UPI001179CBF0|nr:tryptophan-rich sensory protein [Fulvivirga sp. M361]TRX54806.1 tryptophan-rich sensory protein [Fulvivirga sp. M361]